MGNEQWLSVYVCSALVALTTLLSKVPNLSHYNITYNNNHNNYTFEIISNMTTKHLPQEVIDMACQSSFSPRTVLVQETRHMAYPTGSRIPITQVGYQISRPYCGPTLLDTSKAI